MGRSTTATVLGLTATRLLALGLLTGFDWGFAYPLYFLVDCPGWTDLIVRVGLT